MARLLWLSELPPERLEWLWPGRIPLGAITIIDGDPDLGKSLITIDVAARVSTGRAMPGEANATTPSNVLMLCAEDHPRVTVRPRFEAAGADLARVALVDPDDGLLLTADGVSELEAIAANNNVRLLVIDPLMNCLPSDVDAYNDQQIRTVLRPLAALARRCNAAVLIVRHMTKANGGNPLKRGAGSMGIIGATRSGLTVTADGQRRTLRVSKHNLAGPVVGLQYELVDRGGVGAVHWCERADTSSSPGDVIKEPMRLTDELEVVALRVARDQGSCSAPAIARKLKSSQSNASRKYGPVLKQLETSGYLCLGANGTRKLTDSGRVHLAAIEGVSSSPPLSKPPVSEAGDGE